MSDSPSNQNDVPFPQTHKIEVLATDMDGTFIPLSGHEQNRQDLRTIVDELDRLNVALVYVTGRHFELVIDAIESERLPRPPWMICDVGASIYRRDENGYMLLDSYSEHLAELVGPFGRDEVTRLVPVSNDLRLQEEEKQMRFKISYYCDADRINVHKQAITDQLEKENAPYRIIASVDPFNGNGLIDLMPVGVSKAYALQWWAEETERERQSIVFSGDSGNDIAALTAGYRSIVVGNADKSVSQAVERFYQSAGWEDRFIIAKAHATSGVLEGFRYFQNLGR